MMVKYSIGRTIVFRLAKDLRTLHQKLMKLHLPKLLRNAVLACITAVAGITTTVGTAAFTGGVAVIAFSGQQALAAEYTNPDLTATTFADGDTLNLRAGEVVSNALTLDSPDSSIILNVIDGKVRWSAEQGENNGVREINVRNGAELVVDAVSTERRHAVFGSKQGASSVINLDAGSSMTTYDLYGWENEDRGYGSRTVNMGVGSQWNIVMADPSATNEYFYLNNTTINMAGGTIALEEGIIVAFERRSNTIGTTASATAMSTITGEGVIRLGSSATEYENLGYRFDVNRGTFTIDSTNTADLRLAVALTNGNHGVQKTGNGVMEMTADSSACTASFFVREGELKFTGAGNFSSSNMRVDSGATLTLNTSANFASAISLTNGGTLKLGSNQKLAANANLYGSVVFTDTVTIAGNVNISDTTTFDLSNWAGGDSYQLFNVNGGSVAGGFVEVTGGELSGLRYLRSNGSLRTSDLNDLVWAGGDLTWTDGATFTSGGQYEAGDGVTFTGDANVSISASTGVVVLSMTVSGEDTVVSLKNGNPIIAHNGVLIKDGATLELEQYCIEGGADYAGYHGVIRNEVTVESGGTLKFTCKDATGYSGNSTSVINIQEGGTLMLNHYDNETFKGTLNLDGTLDGLGDNPDNNNFTKWDVFRAGNTDNNSTAANIIVASGKHATITDNVQLRLRKDNAKLFVDTNASLTIGSVTTANEGNGVLVKAGSGALYVTGSSTIKGLAFLGGQITFAGTNTTSVINGTLTSQAYSADSTLKVNSGNTVQFTQISIGWGRTLDIDGLVSVTGDAGTNIDDNSYFVGDGTFSTTKFSIGNVGNAHISIANFNVGAGGIIMDGHTINTSTTLQSAGNVQWKGIINVTDLVNLKTSTDTKYEDINGNEGDNGFMNGSVYVIETTGTATIQKADNAGFRIAGTDRTNYEITADNDLVINVNDSSIYYVNTDVYATDAIASVEGFNHYGIRKDGNLTIAAAEGTLSAANAQSALVNATGRGDIILAGDVTMVNGQATKATGTLVIGDGSSTLRTLKMGEGKNNVVNISSFTAVELNNGKLQIEANASDIQNLKVSTAGGSLYLRDTPNTEHAFNLTGTTLLNGDLTITSQWKYHAHFEKLTGSGKLNIEGKIDPENNAGAGSVVSIDSLQGYTGSISFARKSTGANALCILNMSTGGSATLGGLNLAASSAGGVETNLNITGTLTLGPVTVSGAGHIMTLSGDGTLNGFTLNGANTEAGHSLTLAGNVKLGSAITNNATLVLADGLVVDVSALTAVTDGDREVITLISGGTIDGTLSAEKVTGLAELTDSSVWMFDEAGIIYRELPGSPGDEPSIETNWVWDGTSDEWGNDHAGWESESGTTEGQEVVFDGEGTGTVYINGDVKADTITITAGEYSFEQKTNTSDSITASSLTISGADTVVALATDNSIDVTNLNGGVLELKKGGDLAGADTTSGAIVIGGNGGVLKFNGFTDDISSKVSLATDYTGKVKIEVVDDADTTDVVESVTWEKAVWDGANSGVTAIFEKGIEKSGDGTFNINWQYGSSNEVHSGAIVVNEGILNMTGTCVGNPSPRLTFTGGIEVKENAEYNLSLASGLTLNGNLTGKGKVTVGFNGTTGQHEINGDNSAFAGTIIYEGLGNGIDANRVSFKNAAAFGGANTTVVLNQRGFFFDVASTLNSTVKFIGTGNLMDGGSNTTYTFTGKILGDANAVWSSKDKVAMTIGLQGDISAFAGTFTIGAGSTWILGGEGVASTGWKTAGIVQTKIGGDIVTVDGIEKSPTVKTQYSNATTLSGVISGKVNLQQSGAGTLILTAENTTTGKLTIDEGKRVQLGTADVPAEGGNAAVAGVAGQWAGASLAGAGTLELVNGSLTSAMENANDSTAKIAVNAAAGKAISLGNTSSAMLTSVKLAAGSTLTGVTGELTVGSAPVATNLRSTPAPVLTELNLTLIDANIGEGAAGTAMISGSDIVINDATKTTISISTDDLIDTLKEHRDGKKESWLTLTDGKLTCNNSTLQSLALADTLATYGIRLDRVDGGSIVASGAVEDVYFVLTDSAGTDPHTVDHYNTLGMYVGTVIEENQTLEIKLDGDNDTATKVKLSNLMGGTNSSLVVTNNKDTGVVTVELHNEAQAKTGENAPYDTIAAETTMGGSITGNKGTELVKAGTGTLMVNGKVVADELDIRAGALNLNNADNTVTTLNGTGGTLQLGSGSKLTVSGGSLAGVAIKAADGATAAPTLDIDGDLALTGTSALTGLELDMSAGKKLSLAATTNDVVLLNGSGEVQGVAGTILSLDNTKAATYSGSFTGAGTLKVEEGGATFTLENVNTTGSSWNITNSGNLKIDISGDEANPAPASLTLKDVTLGANSSTEFVVNTDADVVFRLTSLSTDSGAVIKLTSTGVNDVTVDPNGNIILGYEINLDNMADGQTITLNGPAFNKFSSTAELANVDGNLVVKTTAASVNKYQALASSKNSKAGAALMWNAPISAINASPVLQRLNQQLAEAVTNGTSCEDLLAAVAGASNAVLGMAAHGDLDRQVQAIRNRTTTMGVDQSVVHDDMPYFNAWINAEGNFSEMSDAETAGGYKLNSWGGTVGFDVDFTPTFTAGMALTAMYGDLSVTGVDQASGDLNSYYVSAFARYCASAWTHTFVATVGLTDISMKRTVMGEDIDSTTDGMGFALMYEVGHVFALDEDATACLQPIFNITWRHTSVNGYDEKGSDLALKVGNQTLDTVTLGLGARMQAVVGESMYNRTSIFEARVLAKFDIGDRRSTTDVQLAGVKADIESAERGAIGLEAGAGLTIPLGDDGGNLFMDAAVELRADYMNVNGTVGYRINF